MRPLFKYFILGIFLGLLPLAGFAEDSRTQLILWIADFEDSEAPKNTGVWVHNILDPEQGLKMKIVQQDMEQKKTEKVLRLDYDVDSPNPAMVGFWVNLRNQDLRGFDTLHLNLKAGGGEQFPGNIALQFTDANNHKAPYLISNIPPEWKEFQVALKKFNRINDWSKIKEFEIIIDDINARLKEGIIFIDGIYVSKDRVK